MAGGTASPVAVAKAKDRIRQAFSETWQQTQIPPASSDTDTAAVTSAQTATTAAGSTWIKLARADDPQTTATSGQPASTSANAAAPEISPAPVSPATTPRTISSRPAPIPTAITIHEADTEDAQGNSPVSESQIQDLREAPSPKSGTTTATVNLRETEDKNAKIVAVLPEGTEVRYSDCSKWWCNVAHGGKSGYVGQKFLARD